MSEETVKLWWDLDRFHRELAKPTLQESVRTELVAIKMVAGGPGSEKGGGGERQEAPRVAEGKAMFGPAEEKGLR